MVTLRIDAEQRFTCRGCTRCCRGWDVVVGAQEAAAYRQARAERWFRERDDGPEGAERDPFDPMPGAFARIRRRADGACGFLSLAGRCRIHEELGGEGKPLACRVFPFAFARLPAGATLAGPSFSCPTVVANSGEPLAAQARQLERLARAWRREHPEAPAAPLEYLPGRSLSAGSLEALRAALRTLLDRRGAHGTRDLRANTARMAALLEDLARHRVVRLADDAFAEYLAVVANHASGSDKPCVPRRPSRVARLLSRGLLFAVEAVAAQHEGGPRGGMQVGRRLRLLALLAHCHGLWPPVGAMDLGASRHARVDLDEAATHELVQRYLRAQIAALGSSGRPVLDEIAAGYARLHAALRLAAARAGRAHRAVAGAEDLSHGLTRAGDLDHAPARGLFGAVLATLTGGLEALHLFAWDHGIAPEPPA